MADAEPWTARGAIGEGNDGAGVSARGEVAGAVVGGAAAAGARTATLGGGGAPAALEDAGVDAAGVGVSTRGGVGAAATGGGVTAPRAATFGGGATAGDVVRGGVTGPAIPEDGVLGSGMPVVAAVPRAAGIEDEGRGDEALRGAAGFFGAEGASIAISTVRPTNPMMTDATPHSISVITDMPRRPGRRG